MAMVRKILNMMIWIFALQLAVTLGWTYNDPVPIGVVWIVLVGLKSALEVVWPK